MNYRTSEPRHPTLPINQADYLIVGGGLAGLLLAWQLRDKNVCVLGGAKLPPASDVSAGVLNPVTGGRLTLMEDFHEFREAAKEIYSSISGADTHFYDTEIRRYFLTEPEIERYHHQIDSRKFADYLGPILPAGESGTAQNDPLGSFTIRNVARVEPRPILQQIREELGNHYRHEDADWNTLSLSADSVTLNGINAKFLICCEGYGVLANPLFRWLPFRPVQGETVTIHAPKVADFSQIIHHRKWIISLGGSRFRIGSTYRRSGEREEGNAATIHPPLAQPTESGKAELLDACRDILELKTKPEVIDHRAGIRPCSRDRVPYLGPHPEHSNIFICNGLGSKGALLAPMLTRQLADHMVHGSTLEGKYLPDRMTDRGFRSYSL